MKSDREFDVIVAGEINPDLILCFTHLEISFDQMETLIDEASLAIGSSSAIFACGAARLGLSTAMIGIVGDDLFGQFMLRELQNRGVNTQYVIIDPHLDTGFSVILNRGAERAILTHLGAISALQAEQIPDELLKRGRHLHVASYFLQKSLQPRLPSLFKRAHALGLTTSLDTNRDPYEAWAGVLEVLEDTDVFLPNAYEAMAISRQKNLSDALAHLSQRGKTVAVKQGAEGGIAQKGEVRVHIPALSVEVLDTVGAGDSFDAGFIFGFIKGYPLEECLKLAVVCGSLSTRQRGGTAGQPTWEEARSWMQKLA